MFLIAITNSWSVLNHPDRSYQLDGPPQASSSGAITGTENTEFDAVETPLTGSYNGHSIQFTVQRPATVTASCTDCTDLTTCACVTFAGTIIDETHIHIEAAATGETYDLTHP